MVKTYRSLDAGSMGDPAVLFACRANVYALASEASSGGPTAAVARVELDIELGAAPLPELRALLAVAGVLYEHGADPSWSPVDAWLHAVVVRRVLARWEAA